MELVPMAIELPNASAPHLLRISFSCLTLCAWLLSRLICTKKLSSVSELVGRSIPRYSKWEELDLNYKVVAEIDQQKCIGCGLCYTACEDGAHQSILSHPDLSRNRTHVEINQQTCVGCNLCSLVCPVDTCITMKKIDTGRDKLNQLQRERIALLEGFDDKRTGIVGV